MGSKPRLAVFLGMGCLLAACSAASPPVQVPPPFMAPAVGEMSNPAGQGGTVNLEPIAAPTPLATEAPAQPARLAQPAAPAGRLLQTGRQVARPGGLSGRFLALPPPPITAAPTPLPPTPLPPDVNPLTGLRVSDPELLERRPLGVKITIFPREARPQWGLSQADLVYEYYLEHGLTRFFALFYGQDSSRVGPVRSARFFDEHLVRMYKSVFVFANADRKVLDPLLETDLVDYFVVERRDNCPPICRDPWMQGYNNLFTDTRQLSEYIRERGVEFGRPDLSGMVFGESLPPGGVPGGSLTGVYSVFSYHLWAFDPSSGRYLRFQDAADDQGEGETLTPLVDRLTQQTLSAENVVVLLVPHHYYSETPEIVLVDLLGRGPGYAFRDGEVFPVTWTREEEADVLTLYHPDGSPYALKPGVTFFQVLGQSSRVWQFGSDWRFEFQIP